MNVKLDIDYVCHISEEDAAERLDDETVASMIASINNNLITPDELKANADGDVLIRVGEILLQTFHGKLYSAVYESDKECSDIFFEAQADL